MLSFPNGSCRSKWITTMFYYSITANLDMNNKFTHYYSYINIIWIQHISPSLTPCHDFNDMLLSMTTNLELNNKFTYTKPDLSRRVNDGPVFGLRVAPQYNSYLTRSVTNKCYHYLMTWKEVTQYDQNGTKNYLIWPE